MNNSQQPQVQQQAAQASAPKQPVSPAAANDEVAQVAQLGYN